MNFRQRILITTAVFVLISLACRAVNWQIAPSTATPELQTTAFATPTALPSIPVEAGEANPDEPVFIIGDIPYTSPFFINSTAEPFVLLEDQAGFIERDHDFQFRLEGQAIGQVQIQDEGRLTYSLALPAIPQGTYVDVDNNGQNDTGVQVFAIAYWSNTWGGPFLEERDGTGWSTAYASTITDPENEDEIKGGLLVVWAPDEHQALPIGFGTDGLIFTDDDPTGPIPAGYSLVDLNQEPFRIYKEARPEITLHEGVGAVNDYSKMSYTDAFEALFTKAMREYPFTTEKGIDWQALYEQFGPRVANAKNPNDFYRAIQDFTYQIPDAHVGMTFNAEVFFEERGGSFGLVLAELSDNRVIVTQVLPETPGDRAGIKVGAEIVTWDQQPVTEAINHVVPYLGPYSTEHSRRLGQVLFLTRVPPGTRVQISFRNPGEMSIQDVNLEAEVEYESLFQALAGPDENILELPVEGSVLESSGLGYIRITTFSDDYNLMARLWDRFIQGLKDSEVPGLIIDMRSNGGGNGDLAIDFTGYFFDEEITLFRGAYYNEGSGKFEYSKDPQRIKPAPLLYEGPIAVLVSPDCVSACEGFVYALKQGDRSVIVGHYPTAGAFGEVGRGQYTLPEEISLQFPTGRPETMGGELLIEGVGIIPDITVPVTEGSALGQTDAVLEAAIQALNDKISEQ